mgnify:CR=1 FL=1
MPVSEEQPAPTGVPAAAPGTPDFVTPAEDGAVTAAAQAGKYAIGVDSDQYFTLPEAAPRMLSSAMKLITPGVAGLLKMAKEGTFPSGNYTGTAGYAPFHDLEKEVSAEIKAKMEEINAALLDGSLTTNVPPAKP